MLQMPYPSLLRQPQSQANAGKSSCAIVVLWYFLGQVFLSVAFFFLKMTFLSNLQTCQKYQTTLRFYPCLIAARDQARVFYHTSLVQAKLVGT